MGARQLPATAKAVDAVKSGRIGVAAAARRFGLDESTIYKALKSAGWKSPNRRR